MKGLKNIYFVQASNRHGVNVRIPYAVGCIAAYAWDDPVIRENFRLGHFTFLRTPVAQVLESFDDPFMVAFSNYVWNFEYNKALAKAVKKRWLACLVLFWGGTRCSTKARRSWTNSPLWIFCCEIGRAHV